MSEEMEDKGCSTEHLLSTALLHSLLLCCSSVIPASVVSSLSKAGIPRLLIAKLMCLYCLHPETLGFRTTLSG